MKFPIYQVDAFAQELFTGNPAAVVVLSDWLDPELLLNISSENNLAETAFIVEMPDCYEIKWFTPKTEVDLCGHATLASAFVVCTFLNPNKDEVTFMSEKSGKLTVKKSGNAYELDFPIDELKAVEENISSQLAKLMGIKPLEILEGKSDLLLIYKNEKDIKELKPDLCNFDSLNYRGVIVTAPGDDVDFVSRFFAPKIGIMEDPVTGSAHTTLTAYWHGVTKNIDFSAKQLSQRGGVLQCVYCGDRVKISGTASLYLKGEISIS